MKLIDLSHVVEDGMEPYPGFPAPRISAFMDHEASRDRYEGKAEFYLTHFDIVGAVGTYMDSPFHRYPDGLDVSQLPLESVAALPGVCTTGVAVPSGGRAVDCECDLEPARGGAVLIHTGWDTRWGTEAYWELGPFIAPGLLDRLMRVRPALVGVDFWNVDDVKDPSRPVHTALLAEGILVVEHMCNLDALPERGFRFYAVPPRLRGGASFTVRAFAEVE